MVIISVIGTNELLFALNCVVNVVIGGTATHEPWGNVGGMKAGCWEQELVDCFTKTKNCKPTLLKGSA